MTTINAGDIREGDLIDLDTSIFFKDHPTAPYELGEVSYVERETEHCVCIGIEGVGTAGYDPTHPFLAERPETGDFRTS
jgi:hypothetical protein